VIITAFTAVVDYNEMFPLQPAIIPFIYLCFYHTYFERTVHNGSPIAGSQTQMQASNMFSGSQRENSTSRVRHWHPSTNSCKKPRSTLRFRASFEARQDKTEKEEDSEVFHVHERIDWTYINFCILTKSLRCLSLTARQRLSINCACPPSLIPMIEESTCMHALHVQTGVPRASSAIADGRLIS